jgi:SMC interacting uncharacterized protein involved in chromosome segregation
LGEERNAAFAAYKVVQQMLTEFLQDYESVGKDAQDLQKRLNDVGIELTGLTNATMNRDVERQEAVVEIQKTIGEVQGYLRSDFEGVKAKELIKEASEFAKKSGPAWTRLSADPAAIDKATARNNEVNQQMRILGARVKDRNDAWKQAPVGNALVLKKYQGMLQMVHDEYMQELAKLQTTLTAYQSALAKQRVKAQAEVDKAAKASAKAEAKASKVAKKK